MHPKGKIHTCVEKKTKHPKGVKSNIKNENNRVTQKGDEDEFEDDADKISREESDNEQEDINEEKNSNLHGKTGDFSEKLNFIYT